MHLSRVLISASRLILIHSCITELVLHMYLLYRDDEVGKRNIPIICNIQVLFNIIPVYPSFKVLNTTFSNTGFFLSQWTRDPTGYN